MFRSPRVAALAATCALVLAVQSVAAQERSTELMDERSLSVGAGGALVVDVGDGDINISTHSGSGVNVEIWATARDMEWAREYFDRMEFDIAASGTRVSVSARDPQVTRREWRQRRYRGVSIRVDISIPQQFNLDIETEDGDISLDGVNGTVAVRTSDGDVSLGNIEGPSVRVRTSDGDVVAGTINAPDVSIDTSDGDIRVMEAAAGTVRMETSDGDIMVRSATGNVRLETSDGEIVVGLRAIERATLRTNDGDIVIYAPDDFAADLSLRGEDLRLDRDVTVVGTVTRRSIRGQLNGGGAELDATASDGSITLRSGTPRMTRRS